MSEREVSPYCVHGTYIGYPLGPDYMCGACEDGATYLIVGVPMWRIDLIPTEDSPSESWKKYRFLESIPEHNWDFMEKYPERFILTLDKQDIWATFEEAEEARADGYLVLNEYEYRELRQHG